MEPKDVRRAMRYLAGTAKDVEAKEYWISWLTDKTDSDGLFFTYLQTHPLSPSLRSKVALQIIIYKLEQ